MKKVVVCILVMLFSVCSYGQEGKFLPEVIPPSPEAAALSRFTDVPVSHYTGLPNVSIPIHTISQKGIQIPINLSYHARGVKVSEIAPRTGMGWSLTYGGSISRQVRGKADDAGGNFTYLRNKDDFINYSKSRNVRENVDMREQLDPGYDFYPDQFNFNAGNTSGKFILDYTDGQPVTQSFGDIKITYTREKGSLGPINAFEVKDSNGNTYYYGKSKDGKREAVEYQYSKGISVYIGNVRNASSNGFEKVYNSWKLMDIETPYGELISYHYTLEDNLQYINKAYDKHDSNSSKTNSLENLNNINAINAKLSEILSNEWQLERIEYNQGSIVFTKQTTRREDYNGYALDNISINDINNNLIKSFKLNYSYTESTDQSNLLWYFKNNNFSKDLKRLFLTSIEEKGRDNVKLSPYTFNYNPIVLPSRFSTRQDYWGYYNGAEKNGPFLRMFEYGLYKPDRRVHLEKSEAGLLQEIIYPTGGKTKFTYEHNYGLVPFYAGFVRLPNINPGSESEVNIKLTKKDFYDTNTGLYKPVNIEVSKEALINYKVGCYHLRGVGEDIPDCLFYFLREGAVIEPSKKYTVTGKSNLTFNVGLKNIPGIPITLHLEDHIDFEINISYEIPTSSETRLYAGGKRIKKIEYITEDNTTVKEFEYKTPDDDPIGLDSGAIIGLPGYINRGTKEDLPANYTHYFDQSSAFSTFQPNSIGYSHVTEYYGSKEENEGKTEYTFTNITDEGGDFYEFPYHPPTDNEWLRGKNVRTKVFKFNKDLRNYNLVKEVYNKYSYGGELYLNTDFIGGSFPYADFILNPEGGGHKWDEDRPNLYNREKTSTLFKLPLFMKRRAISFDVSTWGYRMYYLSGGTVNLHSSTEKNYLEGDEISTQTEYFYDYDKHYQLAGSEVINSKEEILKTENTYPSAGSRLHTENRISTPIKVKTSKKVGSNTTVLSTQNTIYKDFDGIYLPEKVQTLKGGQALEDRVVFHSYDAKGNPVEVSKKNGTKIYYVWGYNQTQPIAKIESYSTITSAKTTAINKAITASNSDENEATENTLRTNLTALRTAFPEAQVTSFTYDPLIGVTSITDPRGETIYYQYDNFNRLQFIKNAAGHILKEHQYNYKN